MPKNLIGVHVSGDRVAEVLDDIDRAEQLGIEAAWMTTGGARLDSLTTLAVAAGRTTRIMFGTSIVPTFPRHPVVVAQQVQVVAQLAPGRFRLGVGPSHRPTIRGLGIDFRSPLGHLREYLRILKDLLQKGRVDLDGTYYSAHEVIPGPVEVPVMASALRRGLLRALWSRGRRSHQLDLPGALSARLGPSSYAAWGGTGRSPRAAPHCPCSRLRPR